MRAATAILMLMLLAAGHPAAAQTAPFDMSGDRPAGEEPQPVPDEGRTPEREADPLASTPREEQAPAPTVAADADAESRRYVIPSENLMLNGESSSRAWTVYLTPAQADAANALSFAYRNAIVVAPETSQLSVLVNDVVIGEGPVQSSETISERRYEIPPGLLRPGANRVGFRALHRHRTDCDIQSTYELWSELISERSYLTFEQNAPRALSSIDDIRAIGVNGEGRTRFNMVVPTLEQPAASASLMRLSQGLALMAGMPNQSFAFSPTLVSESASGEMTVAVGTASELEPILPNLPEGARSGGMAAFMDSPLSGRPILVISGPTWQAIQGVIDDIVSPMDRPLALTRDALSTQRWHGTDTPLLMSENRLPFSRLGVTTTEFSGRRFRTSFSIGVPADFYADAYGEAEILLDAAYSREILPGSHIDIYVNGNIASTVPVTVAGGGIFRHLPISVTMRHFRPGANLIEIEAILLTAADQVCAPGTAAAQEPRFALFDTSEFRMPDFARIAQLPNLAAVAGTGFPYSRSSEPVALFMDRADIHTLSATATFLGKLAVQSGRLVPIAIESSALSIGDRNAIFAGSISQIPPAALTQLHISDESRTAWGTIPHGEHRAVNTDAAFDEWRSKVRGGSWRGQITVLEEWLKRTFDISLASLRFAPGDEAAVAPAENASFLIAQSSSPGEAGSWILLTAPTPDDLSRGMLSFSQETNWTQMAGHMTLYDAAAGGIETRPVTQFLFVPTQPFSLANYRLIAANWLSTNILSYAVLLTGFSILLGLTTAGLLRLFGRHK